MQAMCHSSRSGFWTGEMKMMILIEIMKERERFHHRWIIMNFKHHSQWLIRFVAIQPNAAHYKSSVRAIKKILNPAHIYSITILKRIKMKTSYLPFIVLLSISFPAKPKTNCTQRSYSFVLGREMVFLVAGGPKTDLNPYYTRMNVRFAKYILVVGFNVCLFWREGGGTDDAVWYARSSACERGKHIRWPIAYSTTL